MSERERESANEIRAKRDWGGCESLPSSFPKLALAGARDPRWSRLEDLRGARARGHGHAPVRPRGVVPTLIEFAFIFLMGEPNLISLRGDLALCLMG